MIIFGSALIEAIRSGAARRTQLISIIFKSGIARHYCDLDGELVVENIQYLGAGCPVIEGISDTDRLQAHDISVTFPVETVTEFLISEDVVNAEVTLSTVWVDFNSGTVFQAPIIDMICMGDVLNYEYGQNGLASIVMMCRTPMFDLSRPPLSFYTDAEQRSIFPNDAGLSKISSLVNLEQAGWTLSATGVNTVYLVNDNGAVKDTAGRVVTDQDGNALIYNGFNVALGSKVWGWSHDYLSEKYYTEYNGTRVNSTSNSYLVGQFGGGMVYGRDTYSPVILKDGFFQVELSDGIFLKLIVGQDGIIFTEENKSLGGIVGNNVVANAYFQGEFYQRIEVHLTAHPTYQYYTESIIKKDDNTNYNYYGKVVLV